MNMMRLFILGTLARGGPMHGHQIRRAAQTDRTELWADVKPGSLYGALHRMEAEETVKTVRTEQEGKRPARTVYEITEAGRGELAAHRDEALREARIAPDPVDLALQFTGDLSEGALRSALEARRGSLASQLASWRQVRESADPYLGEMEKMTFGHTIGRLEAEIAWHDELLERLSALMAAGSGTPSGRLLRAVGRPGAGSGTPS
jgi:DNA-binding PadR family transcriptional regulator